METQKKSRHVVVVGAEDKRAGYGGRGTGGGCKLRASLLQPQQ